MSRLSKLYVLESYHLLFPCGAVKTYPPGVIPRGIKYKGKRPIRAFCPAVVMSFCNEEHMRIMLRLRQVLHPTQGRTHFMGDLQCLA